MDKPLRILVIVNLPWDPRLGASRVYIELVKQWKTAGHHVEVFCLTDAFPRATRSSGRAAVRQIFFRSHAARHVRQNASRFDVIDATIGVLPFPKKRLNFSGLLVARSIGLYRAFDDFVRFSRKRWPDESSGKFIGRYFHRLKRRWLARESDRALQYCDVINLPNADERDLLPKTKVVGKKILIQPYGLNENDRTALAAAAKSPEARLQGKEICFVGMWSLRKGARDWGEIVDRVRKIIPNARFKFLGTTATDQKVLNDLRLSHSEFISCISTYDPDELPRQLGSCAVGLFPSYVEGFGLAVLEQLAAGIPTVAYDVPGPRHILEPLRSKLLVPVGEASAIAGRATEILRLAPDDYDVLANRCRSIANEFQWERIASDTAQQYQAALQELRPPQ